MNEGNLWPWHGINPCTCVSYWLVRILFAFSYCLHVCSEPASLRHQLHSDSGAVSGKSRSSVSEDSRADDPKALTVSSSRSERIEARVSSSAPESRYQLLSWNYYYDLCFVVYHSLNIFYSCGWCAHTSESAKCKITFLTCYQEKHHGEEFLSTYLSC